MFSVNIPIPASANPGNYVVNVSTQNGTLDANRLTGVGVKQLAITALVATPTATAAPSPSVTPTATAKPATSTVGNSSNGSSGGGNGPLMLVLLAIAVVILGIGGVLLFMYAQRRKETPAVSPSSPQAFSPSAGAGQFNQYGAQGNPMTPFSPGQPMNAPEQFDNTPYGAFSNQNWQDNQQVNAFGQNQLLQQGYAMPGAGMSTANRACIRCGSPLAPNADVCGVCGMQNAPYSDPNAPTIAY
jgi:ribosomal protein S27AE